MTDRREAIAVLLVALIGILDAVTGSEVSFSIFYLIPVAYSGRLLHRGAAVLVAVLSAAVWGYLEITTGRPYSAAWIPYWNSAVRLGFFLIVAELIAAGRWAHQRERLLSRTDAFTGIANGRVFAEYLARVIAESRRYRRPFTLAYINLDRFTQVNDEMGHAAGDQVLRAVATAVAQSARATDVVARLGGDEFAVLMPATDEQQARVPLNGSGRPSRRRRAADGRSGRRTARAPSRRLPPASTLPCSRPTLSCTRARRKGGAGICNDAGRLLALLRRSGGLQRGVQ